MHISCKSLTREPHFMLRVKEREAEEVPDLSPRADYGSSGL